MNFLLGSGEHRLPACKSRQLAETGFQPFHEYAGMLPASCRQLRAGSPRSPENRAHDRTFRVAHASRVLAMTSRQRGLFCKRSFRRDAETSTRDARAR